MDKLSELSKPVGYYRLSEDGVSYYLSSPTEKLDEEAVPLYSQEYVSALIKRAEGAEAFCDQMLKYVRTLGSSVISASVVETIMNAAERAKGGK